MAKKRRKGVAVKARTASFEDDRRPLKRGGEVHRLFVSFAPEIRKELLCDVGLSQLRRVGNGRKVELLRNLTDIRVDFSRIDPYICSVNPQHGITIPGAILGPQLGTLLEQAIKILGSNSGRPSVGQLESMCDSLARDHRPEWIKLFLAALVEAHFPSRPEAIEVNQSPRWGGFLVIEEPKGGAQNPKFTGLTEADAETKSQRALRRRMERDERSSRQRQRDEAMAAAGRHSSPRSDVAEQKPTKTVPRPKKSSPLIIVSALEYPMLPRQATITKGAPVMYLYWMYISWGPDQGDGKVRPVLVVGANSSSVWVRPCYSEDWLAGRWRAVEILDWKAAGLTKGSYVSIGLVKLSRKSLRERIGQMSLNDWNRVCRGEVH